ncbi:hypothetical protein L1887_38878 [Cichorium endivia]|nr:hypothetical protein L1887_38878 [Cichorium endivia]
MRVLIKEALKEIPFSDGTDNTSYIIGNPNPLVVNSLPVTLHSIREKEKTEKRDKPIDEWRVVERRRLAGL